MSNLQEEALLKRQQLTLLEREIKSAKAKLVKEKVTPIRLQADELEKGINQQVDAEYKARLLAAREAVYNANELEEKEKVQQSCTVWYPVGTKVELWKNKGRYINGKQKSGEFGLVEVYDGTNPLPDNLRWRKPNVGDIMVRLLKKNGESGLRVEVVSNQNRMKAHFANVWLIEGDTPEDNLYIRSQKDNKDEESFEF